VAGNGTQGYSGDGGPATSAEIAVPRDVAVDGAGNLYIADLANNRIRKVSTSGTITTVAGDGNFGYSGHNGPATSAELWSPYGVAVDGAGTLYIADLLNQRIRKVDVAASALSFGSLTVGQTSAAQSVAVSDVGTAALNFSSFVASSNFLLQSVGDDCVTGTPLAVGATCALGVAFAPTVAGNPLTGSVTVSDDAFNSPQSVILSGAGTPAPLTITASSGTMTYGGTPPTITPSYSGFVNGNTATSLTTKPTCTTTATAHSPAGTYPSSCSGAVDSDYTFSYVSGTVTVTKATLKVTANKLSKTFGAANPALTYTMTGFLNGGTQATATTGAPSLSTTATTASAVGTYPITVTIGTLAAKDYSFSFVNGALTVTKATLKVTANNLSKTYGAANPSLTYTMTGFAAP
jgi:hypothetical protein